ncbi:MAG: hypothetical protein OXG74_00800 [Acidobacteria bacterium]|nr:hypothetical protein [Acidobacteriota bacterium]
MTFDTLAAARTLEDAGLTSKQAEAVTTTIRVAIAEGTATKEDIIRLEARLAELELRLTRRIYALAIAQAGATVALTVTLLRLLA